MPHASRQGNAQSRAPSASTSRTNAADGRRTAVLAGGSRTTRAPVSSGTRAARRRRTARQRRRRRVTESSGSLSLPQASVPRQDNKTMIAGCRSAGDSIAATGAAPRAGGAHLPRADGRPAACPRGHITNVMAMSETTLRGRARDIVHFELDLDSARLVLLGEDGEARWSARLEASAVHLGERCDAREPQLRPRGLRRRVRPTRPRARRGWGATSGHTCRRSTRCTRRRTTRCRRRTRTRWRSAGRRSARSPGSGRSPSRSC